MYSDLYTTSERQPTRRGDFGHHKNSSDRDFARRDRSPDRRRGRNRTRSRSRSRSPEYRSRDRDRDRDRGGDRERDRDTDRRSGRSRSRSPTVRSRDKDRHHQGTPGLPQQHVVLQGLPPAATEASVMADLEDKGACLEAVRVVMDRHSGLAKGFAFIKFISTEHARQFMDKHFPHVSLGGSRVRLEYSKASPLGEDDWICTSCGISNFRKRAVCFQCKFSRDAATSAADHIPLEVNDGRKDVGTIPCNLLVALGLDTLTTEENLFTALQTFNTPITQVRLVKDRLNNQSYGFGFIEFVDIQTATYFMTQTFSHGGLNVEGRSISLAFASHESFVQVFERSEWVTSFYQDAGRSVFLRYWDENAYATAYPSFMGLLDEMPVMKTSSDEISVQSNSITEATRFASIDDELAAFMSEVEGVPGDLTSSTLPQSLNESSNHSSHIYAPPVLSATLSENTDGEITNTNTIEQDEGGDQIQVDGSSDPVYLDTLAEDDMQPEMVPIDVSDEALLKRLPSIEEINRDKCDLNLMACLLCERQFKGLAELNKHQMKSGLH
ncbi:hypothetical protein BDR26DRAFT_828922, partial [Obelidium mucronatum]